MLNTRLSDHVLHNLVFGYTRVMLNTGLVVLHDLLVYAWLHCMFVMLNTGLVVLHDLLVHAWLHYMFVMLNTGLILTSCYMTLCFVTRELCAIHASLIALHNLLFSYT